MEYSEWTLSAPVNITWEITHECNLKCIHCLSASDAASPRELGFDECCDIVDQLAALKVFEINFGGGEPLLKDFFLPLLRYIHGKDIVTCVSTNGTVLTEEAIDLFTGNRLVNIQVSLDGATPEVNDRIRGEGTFEKIIRGIERLSGKNISLSINTVATSLNFNQLDRLKELANSYGARLRVSRFRPSGRASESWEELRLDSFQLGELAAWLVNDPSILTGDSFFSISHNDRKQLGLDMCGACKMTCCINPCGDVFPCAFLQEKQFCSGNLRDTSLPDIWNNSAVFQKLRHLEAESCRQCRYFEKCRGGCPAVAYFVTRDLNRADPECRMNWQSNFSAK